MSAEIYFLQAKVYHGRTETAENSFCYPVLNLYFNTVQWELIRAQLKRYFFGLVNIRAQDYLVKKNTSINTEIALFVRDRFSYQAEEVYLQTLPRMFGYVFNPVSFWYFKRDDRLEAVLCEVNNTFGEKHYYWLYQQGEDLNNRWLEARKEFHVSPFFNVDGKYRFRFSIGGNRLESTINLYNDDNSLRLATWIKGDLISLAELSLLKILIKYGWLTPLVVLRIHYQALRLFFKKVRFYKKPQAPKTEVTYETSFDRS